jgi:hypothetical protein
MSNVHLVYGLGIAGGVLALARNIFIAMILKVNAQALMGQVTKLIQAGNLDRALKLCQALPRAYLTSGLIPALEVFQKGNAKRGDLVRAYEQGVATKKPMLMFGRILGVVAGLLVVAGVAVALMHAETIPSETNAAPIIGGFLVVGGEMMSKRLQDEANVAFGRLLEVLKENRT